MRRKATDVMLELIASAQAVGLSAKYVLFDSWFSSPKTLISLKEKCHMDTIALIKRTKQSICMKGKTLISSRSTAKPETARTFKIPAFRKCHSEKDDEALPARIVCVRNKSNRKDWLALISTDTNLSEEELIRVYGKRWDIEVFFKSCKSYLKLVKECRSISYDALNAHVAIVFTRYMLLSVAKRRNEDDKTICELFYCLMDELEDITFSQSMQIILEALLDTVMEFFHI